MKIIMYMENLAPIGGIETGIYYLTNELKKYHDIELIYDIADKKQLERLSIKTEKRDKSKRYCADIVIKKSAFGFPDNLFGEVYIQMIHANYSELEHYKYKKWNKTDTHIAVSETSRNSFLSLFPEEECNVIYNFVPKLKRKRKVKNDKLMLLSATRLTDEKGYKRMVKLAQELDKKGINYEWHVYTNSKVEFDSKKVIKKEPNLYITDDFHKYDYIVQLSDTESFCYTVHESLSLGIPVIVTNWTGVKETVEDGINGYILDMNMNNCKIDDIVNNIPSGFSYTPKSSVKDWVKYLNKVKIKKVKVKALKDFTDMKEGIERKEGEIFEATKRRIEDINSCEFCRVQKIPLVEIINNKKKD